MAKKKRTEIVAGEVIEKPESQLKVMWDTLKKNKAALAGLVVIILLIFLAIFGDLLAPYDPEYSDMAHTFVKPCAEYWFGTDQLGRDIFSRVLSGTKVSLLVGLSAVAFSLVIGTILGSVAGYFGGKVDGFIMRCMDIMLSIPSILLAYELFGGVGLELIALGCGVCYMLSGTHGLYSSQLFVTEKLLSEYTESWGKRLHH